MADRRFYPEARPLDVEAILRLLEGEMRGEMGGVPPPSSLRATHAAPAAEARAGAVCFVLNKKVAATVADESGIICLVSADLAASVAAAPVCIIVPDPKAAFGLVLREMYPSQAPVAGISPHAAIDETASIGKNVRIEAGAFIAGGVEIGDHVWIKSGVHIGEGCVIGAGTVIDANASIQFSLIGAEVVIGANTVLGGSGFGIGHADGGNILMPHLGRVVVGDHCTIGGASCIDRGFMQDTVIGRYVMIDNLVQISHNVVLGDGNVICGQVGIAGSVEIGSDNIFGAQSGVADNVKIGSGNIFAGRSGVTKSVGDGEVFGGMPAVPIARYRREVAALRRLAHPKS